MKKGINSFYDDAESLLGEPIGSFLACSETKEKSSVRNLSRISFSRRSFTKNYRCEQPGLLLLFPHRLLRGKMCRDGSSACPIQGIFYLLSVRVSLSNVLRTSK